MDLITGATGYVGGRLLARLLRERRELRVLARNPAPLGSLPGVELVRGDVVEGTGLERALAGVTTAYYLVHSMGVAGTPSFGGRDRLGARNFARAARAAGVERIVYLGGLVPQHGRLSDHLSSRLEVEKILMDAVPSPTALRASILVGAGSSSFQILVRLVERLRFLPLPGWRDNLTQPIDERDAIEYLARTPTLAGAAGRSLDIAGPDVISYGSMIERIADMMGVARTPLRLSFSQTPAASAVVAGLTGQSPALVRPLMESLESDLLPRDDAARALYGLRPRGFDRAVEHALRDWERNRDLGAR